MKPLKTMIFVLLVASAMIMIYAGHLGIEHPNCAGAVILSLALGFVGMTGVITYDGSEP